MEANLKLESSHNLNILLDYGIDWSKEKISRDIVQNFFDSVLYNEKYSFHNDVKITKTGNNGIKIEGPIEYSFEYFHAIGATTKSAGGFAGFFGEGLKMSILALFKEYTNVKISVQIGNKIAYFYLKDYSEILRNSLTMDIYEAETEIVGSNIIICGIDQEIIDLFLKSKSLFFYPENELLGEVVFNKDGLALYFLNSSVEQRGYIFYKFQLRGSIVSTKKLDFDKIPLVFVVNKEVSFMNKDRDRNDVTIPQIVKIIDLLFSKLNEDNILSVYTNLIAINKKYIFHGSLYQVAGGAHIIAYELSKYLKQFNRPDSTKPNGYEHKYFDFFLENEYAITRDIKEFEKTALKAAGFKAIDVYLAVFGVNNLDYALKLANPNPEDYKRKPSECERDLYGAVKRYFITIIGHRVEKLSIHKNPLFLELRILIENDVSNKLPYHGLYQEGSIIYIHEITFKKFSTFTMTCLHELSHFSGSDHSSEFSYFLTDLIGAMLANPLALAEYRAEYEAIVKKYKTI